MRYLLLIASLPLHAEFLTIEQQFGGIECASCAVSLEKSFQRLRGVRKVSVDPSQSLVRLELEEGNRVRLEDIRDRIKGVGYTPQTAVVRVAGTLSRNAGRWQFEVAAGDIYALELTTKSDRLKDFERIVVSGMIPVPASPHEKVLQVRNIH
jgi:cation transport ATPase